MSEEKNLAENKLTDDQVEQVSGGRSIDLRTGEALPAGSKQN